MSTTTSSRPPTTAQLRFLRTLAERTGQTFIAPTTVAQASSEIRRLIAAPRTSRRDRQIERITLRGHTPAASSSNIRDDEVGGWGASARWAGSRS